METWYFKFVFLETVLCQRDTMQINCHRQRIMKEEHNLSTYSYSVLSKLLKLIRFRAFKS